MPFKSDQLGDKTQDSALPSFTSQDAKSLRSRSQQLWESCSFAPLWYS